MESWGEIWWVRLALAVILGSILGFERFWVRKPAGIRTMSLVSAGSATFMILAERMQAITAFNIDPTRVAQGIITGIGFLGAGTILQRREGVRGLTTAATVWVSAAVGLSAGAGALDVALATTVAGLLVLQGYGALETWMRRRGVRPEGPVREGRRKAEERPDVAPPNEGGSRRRRRRRRRREEREGES